MITVGHVWYEMKGYAGGAREEEGGRMSAKSGRMDGLTDRWRVTSSLKMTVKITPFYFNS